MVSIKPRIIKDIIENMRPYDFDLWDGGSHYLCHVNDCGSITFVTKNKQKQTVSIKFDGSQYIEVKCSNGKMSMYNRGRYNYSLMELLKNKFDVEHADENYIYVPGISDTNMIEGLDFLY